MSRFNVDKVVAPTRCPRAFASLSKFLKRPPVYLLLLVSPFLLSYVARIRDSSYRAVTVRGESGIAEVRVLALSARNYVRELWNFMYGVSVSKYANSIRPFLRWEIVPSSCKLSPRSNGLGFSFSFSPLLDPLHASILCEEKHRVSSSPSPSIYPRFAKETLSSRNSIEYFPCLHAIIDCHFPPYGTLIRCR